MKELIRGLQKQMALKIEKAIATMFIKVQIKEVYEENGKFYMKATSVLNAREIPNVKLTGTKIGNGRGIIVYPKIGDLAIVLNILGEYFYLTAIYDEYTDLPDNQVLTDKESLFVINNDFGSYICLQKSNDIILKTKDGSKIRLYNDGRIKMFNANNFGFEIDASDNVTIRGNTVNHTQTAGTWDTL